MNYGRDGLDLEDQDRLPWLEPVDVVDEDDAVAPAWKVIALVIGGLAALGLIVGGIYWLQSRMSAIPSDAELIAAPAGDYKVPANEADGRSFKGEGDASHATSEGVETDGRIDAASVPEAPMVDVSRGSVTAAEVAAADRMQAEAAPRVTTAVKPGGLVKPWGEGEAAKSSTPATTPAPAAKAAAAAAPAGGGSAMVQLGAYASDAVAKDAWGKFTKRFDYLGPLSTTIQPVKTANGTLYRLRARVGTPAEAATLCGRLKVAGESCIVVN